MSSNNTPGREDFQVGTRDKSVPWYTSSVKDVSEGTRELLEKYSHIPRDQIIPHILKVVSTLPNPPFTNQCATAPGPSSPTPASANSASSTSPSARTPPTPKSFPAHPTLGLRRGARRELLRQRPAARVHGAGVRSFPRPGSAGGDVHCGGRVRCGLGVKAAGWRGGYCARGEFLPPVRVFAAEGDREAGGAVAATGGRFAAGG
ncbi:hypothetical protein M8818_002284 [Zalaria obscura]|uniref:Uncharacterized protein n=1 Tax=Zalaria obscura TaxID=2024903 RepID=A0ACC3SHC2_9PEZI